ncbi:MAG: translocation/assembly module TamB domain-containing protein [Litorimonas sp.]
MADTVKNRWPKRIGLALLSVLAGLLIAVIILILLLRSGPGRDFVEARLEGMEFVGQTVEIDGLTGSVLGSFGIDRITLQGRDGPWLVAQDVRVDWSPRDLLSKTLNVDRVRVGDLDILQRPILVPGESGGDPAVTNFDIKGIDLPDVSVSDALFGQAINASASGTLLHGPDGGSAVMSARSDQGDKVETDLSWSPLLVLSGDADIYGAPGGLLAGLLRLDTGQSVTADVSTEEQITTVKAKVDGVDFAALTIKRGQSSVAVIGTIEPNRLPPLDRIAAYLGGTTQIDAVLPLDEGAPASLTLRSPALILEATGVRRDDRIVLDRVMLNATDPLKPLELDGITIGRIIAEGRGIIGDTYEFDGTITGTALHYQDYKVDRLSGPAVLTFSDGILGFDTALRGRAAQSALAQADGARVVAKGELNVSRQSINLSQANIFLPGLSVQGQGTIGYGVTKTADFTGLYNIDTAVFRDGPSATLTGRATVTQTPNGPVADLTGQAQKIENIPSAAEPLVMGGVNYTARVRVEQGRVVVPRFTARNEQLTASGTARWQNGQLSSDIQYSVERYDFAAVNASDVAGTAVLSGPPSMLEFKTDLNVADLNAGALDVSNALLTATGTYSDGVVTMTGSLAGDSPQGRVETEADIVLANGGWDLTALNGSMGTFKATGGLSGIGGDLATLRADLILSGTSDLIPAEAIAANVLINDSQVDIDATLSGVAVGPLQNGTVKILAKGPRDAVTFQINAEGMTVIEDLERPLNARANGLIDLSKNDFVTQIDFDVSISDLALAGAASAQRAEAGWAATVDAAGLGGAFTLALDPTDAGALSFNLNRLSVPQLARLIARPATEGTVSAAGRFTLVADHIEGAAQISLDDLRSPISDSEPITVVMDLTLANEQFALVMGATEGGLSGQARLEGAVETFPRAPFVLYPPAVPLAGTADLRGEIGPIIELFLPPRTNVAGQIETDLKFTIPSTPTGLQGRIALTDGVFEQGQLGLELIDITVMADLSGETITVPRVSARGRDGGTLEGSGRMGLGAGTGTVDIKAEKLRVLSRREGQAEVSGTLDVSRTAELLRLGGMLRVTDADLNIGRLPKPGLPTLEIDFGEEEAEEETRSFASSATEIDVRIVSDGRIKVRGRGLNASMNLDAAVRGSFDAPIVTGQMSVDRGRFDFLSKRFEFRESVVTLRENVLQSRLSLEAVRQTSELTAVVAITGTLERPEIKLTSEPNLPEDEVLSRILFGRSPTQLSAIETARLAAAISQLSGGSGFDLFGTLENAIGLDTLEIGQNDTGQTQLTTGKYLSDDVYLEVRTAAEGTPGLVVEWQVRDSISLEAETLPNERQRLSVQWKKDFD